VIIIEALTMRYGASTAVDDVSFTARAGRVTGYLGPNGAGKRRPVRLARLIGRHDVRGQIM